MINSRAFKSHRAVCGYLPINCFLAASPSDKYRILITFLLAGSSSRSSFCGSSAEVGFKVVSVFRSAWNGSFGRGLSAALAPFQQPSVLQFLPQVSLLGWLPGFLLFGSLFSRACCHLSRFNYWHSILNIPNLLQ